VQCVRGALFDVVVDLRRDSPAFCKWFGVELSQTNRRMVYVPAGVAHGFQTLVPETDLVYSISAFHVPDAGRGVRWNDPAFGIVWPEAGERHMSERDRAYPDFQG
jgi:dTDP-4-dehydrorhamnose 3,5-epimerase